MSQLCLQPSQLDPEMEEYIPPKVWYPPMYCTRIHSITHRKITDCKFATVAFKILDNRYVNSVLVVQFVLVT